MNRFDSIDYFYKTITTRFGYDWILGYHTSHLGRQKFIFSIMVGFLFLNFCQVISSLRTFVPFGVWAICIILFSSALFSVSAALLLIIHGKRISIIINWCRSLYVAKIDEAFVHIRNKFFKKCARETLFLTKAVFYGFILILVVLFTVPILLYFATGRVMLPATFYFPKLPHEEFKFYVLNYISQFLGVFCATHVTMTLNSILIMVLLHAKYQMDLIETCMNLTINRVGLDLKEERVKEALEVIIKMHVDVLK